MGWLRTLHGRERDVRSAENDGASMKDDSSLCSVAAAVALFLTAACTGGGSNTDAGVTPQPKKVCVVMDGHDFSKLPRAARSRLRFRQYWLFAVCATGALVGIIAGGDDHLCSWSVH